MNQENCPKNEENKNKLMEFNVFYKKDEYDIYSFLNNHPGGVNYIQPYKDKNVEKRMKDTYHSSSAYYLFKEYKSKKTRKKGDQKNDEEDLENLVNWDQPMLQQVGNLGPRYKEWVTSPVDRNLRLFRSDILENLTVTPWYVVPIVWVPTILYILRYGSLIYLQNSKENSIAGVISNVILGLFLWTFIEYSLHRWVFHIEPSGHSRVAIYFHFSIHGLHHKVPFDSRRLVFPPVPAAVIVLFFYKILSLLLAEHRVLLVLSGGIMGYVIYDMMHFYLHHGAPEENTVLYNLKRVHNQHHFAQHESGFGISSTFWDKAFGTMVRLRKLNMPIRW